MVATPVSQELERFYGLPSCDRRDIVLRATAEQHRYHFERNAAYRETLSARGVGPDLPDDLALLLRPAALTFKSYAERIGLFPQDEPAAFMPWLAGQLSVPLARERWRLFHRRYGTLEAFLRDIERIYSDLGLEIVTSTGTSGRASIVVRNAATVALATEAFFTAIRVCWGVQRGMALVFMMPEETRVAMARTARFGTRYLDWKPVYYTVPFPATPDRLRIRAGRSFRPGLAGLWERRLLHPFMSRAEERLAKPRYLARTLACLRECVAGGRRLMLLGGPAQLHGLARVGAIRLPTGSRVATGGGLKESYAHTMADIRADLRAAFGDVAVSDVYGMAEANWAAFECEHGNYHLPPWLHAVVTDDDDRILGGPEATGLLAFFDPIGGGALIPPFFQTADRARLVNGGAYDGPPLACPCGSEGAFIRGAIQRVDLLEEAGCAAQV